MDNEQLLNSIYQNIQMVLETIPEIRKVTTDCDFKEVLNSHEQTYQNLLSVTRQRLDAEGYIPEEINELLKNYSEWMTKLKAMTDKSTSHLSEMCITGYTMGMIQSIQKWRQYCDASKDTLLLAQQLSIQHQKSIDSLKKYL